MSRRSFFQRTDASLEFYKLFVVAAQLFGAGYIFVAMVFEFLQNRIQFCNYGIKFFIELLVHPLLNCLKNNIGLIGQKLLRRFGMFGEKLLCSLGMFGEQLLRSLGMLGETFIQFPVKPLLKLAKLGV